MENFLKIKYHTYIMKVPAYLCYSLETPKPKSH